MLPDHTFNAKAFDYYEPLNKVRRHFEINYSQPISLADAAAIAGFETKHFGKFFRRKVGMGFKHWTMAVRIQMAMDLITKQHRPLTDIAFDVGFSDYGTFERAFKRYAGLCPREFRRKLSD